MARRVRLTGHAQSQLRVLHLSEQDVLQVIGSFDRSEFDSDAGLNRVSLVIRHRRVEVIFAASEESLVVVDVRLIGERD